VLIVKGDLAGAELVENYLDRGDHVVSVVDTVTDMRKTVGEGKVDLVILDVGLPDEDGWSALRWLRARGETPVVMLSGKVDTNNTVIGLEFGADGYFARPFDLSELPGRLHSIQRWATRARAPAPDDTQEGIITFSGWVLDLASQRLKTEAGKAMHLTQAEYRILVLLARNLCKVVSRDQLMTTAARRGWVPLDRSVDVHISNLRRKLDFDAKGPSLIRSIRGTGYMLVPEGRSSTSGKR